MYISQTKYRISSSKLDTFPMARHHRSRKHPLFVLFIFTGLLEVVVFYFAVSRITKEVAAGVKIHWFVAPPPLPRTKLIVALRIPYFVIGLAVVSCIYAALSIILFTSLPPRQISCCSLITVTTLFLGTAWSLSTVIQIFEVPNNRPSSSPTSTEPPMMKMRAILSGVVAYVPTYLRLAQTCNLIRTQPIVVCINTPLLIPCIQRRDSSRKG